MELSSIAMRLRRVTTEDAYVKVPVTEAILADLSNGGEALIAAACALGADTETRWVLDGEPIIEAHPIQKPMPA